VSSGVPPSPPNGQFPLGERCHGVMGHKVVLRDEHQRVVKEDEGGF
jgi:hypothetical protein